MQVDLSLMQHLANLSRLEFSEKEMTAMQSDMQAMIGFVEQLNELDTSGVEPLRHMSELENVYREDMPAAPVAASQALSPAKNHNDQFFKVPKVIG